MTKRSSGCQLTFPPKSWTELCNSDMMRQRSQSSLPQQLHWLDWQPVHVGCLQSTDPGLHWGLLQYRYQGRSWQQPWLQLAVQYTVYNTLKMEMECALILSSLFSQCNFLRGNKTFYVSIRVHCPLSCTWSHNYYSSKQ